MGELESTSEESDVMKHMLKFIVGFSIVMAVLLLFVVVVNFGLYVFYSGMIIVAIWGCYSLGNLVWNMVELVYDEKEFK